MPPEYWSFIGVSALLVVMPGPDMALVARNTVAGGRSDGAYTIAGTMVGLMVHATAAVVGLSAVIATSARLFTAVKVAGAVYLVWLGVSALFAARSGDLDRPVGGAPAASGGRGNPFTQGLLTNVLNPKIAVFFLSFVPQFIGPGSGATPQIVVLSATFLALGAIWLSCYLFAVHALAGVLGRPSVTQWFERIVGVALIGMGVGLAVDRT
ncbi:MAG: LysE family translocator [Actinomycetota bacterium]